VELEDQLVGTSCTLEPSEWICHQICIMHKNLGGGMVSK
jgi:hypothetical protein